MSSNNALVGYTGLVGSHLLRSGSFSHLYRSTNFPEARGRDFDHLVFSGARAEKWKANQDPQGDQEHIAQLISILSDVRAERATLISTVDVYPRPVGDRERLILESEVNHAYGADRAWLEREFLRLFPQSLVIRLPALFGQGLKKNVVFDFLNDNQVEKIDSRGSFQFYNLEWLADDVKKAWQIHDRQNERIFNFMTEPLSVREVARAVCQKEFDNRVVDQPAAYDLRSKFSEAWGRQDGYLYGKSAVLEGLTLFARNYSRGETR